MCLSNMDWIEYGLDRVVGDNNSLCADDVTTSIMFTGVSTIDCYYTLECNETRNEDRQQKIEYSTSEGIRRQDGGPMNERMKERADDW